MASGQGDVADKAIRMVDSSGDASVYNGKTFGYQVLFLEGRLFCEFLRLLALALLMTELRAVICRVISLAAYCSVYIAQGTVQWPLMY